MIIRILNAVLLALVVGAIGDYLGLPPVLTLAISIWLQILLNRVSN